MTEQKALALTAWRSFVNRINTRAAKGKRIETHTLEMLACWEQRALLEIHIAEGNPT